MENSKSNEITSCKRRMESNITINESSLFSQFKNRSSVRILFFKLFALVIHDSENFVIFNVIEFEIMNKNINI